MTIQIVGLGPGDGRFLSRQAWEILSTAEVVYLRTARHPAVDDLPERIERITFDHFYEQATVFSDVYDKISSEIIRLGVEASRQLKDIVFAVPGHPLVGEAAVKKIIALAEKRKVEVNVVPGMSFVAPTLTVLGIDGLDGLQLFDALEIAEYHYPPLNTDVPLLLGQVYNRRVASEVKLALMALYPDEHEVVLVHSAGTEKQFVEAIPLHSIDQTERLAHLSSLYVPALPYASTLPALAETVAYLRSPKGCPWDQEQTRQSMRTGFLEEAAEALEAIDDDDPESLSEELGDLMYHLVMQAQIACELGEFNLVDVIVGIESKLKRRHPHVWGDLEVSNSDEVVYNWEKLKAREKEDQTSPVSLLDNVPHQFPALVRSRKIQERVAQIGFDWPSVQGVIEKLAEEIYELEEARLPDREASELGDILFALVNWARWHDIDAEIALRETNLRFEQRFRLMEDLARARQLELKRLNHQELDELWEEAKLAVDAGN